ncbi:hypothetical protein MUK42_13315 [Musa troglodytarum]|uniref:Uncharacterized protein n=1 Tax=Musa troglodytarum TaxID=320322 RepID=A0A9E7L686_9LILI|nr:hypothetical protein MUK42_13315 [Musa troglodytarum]
MSSSTVPRDQFDAYEEEDAEEAGSKGAGAGDIPGPETAPPEDVGGGDPGTGAADGAGVGGWGFGNGGGAGPWDAGAGEGDEAGGLEVGGGDGGRDGGDEMGGQFLTAMTTTTSFCPCWQFPGAPLMKKNGPDRSNLNTESPPSSFWIGLLTSHAS